MEDYRTRFEIIENTKRGRNKYGYNFGSQTYVITENDIDALRNGKQIASTINDEYSIFIQLESDKIHE
mgnify:FL=1